MCTQMSSCFFFPVRTRWNSKETKNRNRIRLLSESITVFSSQKRFCGSLLSSVHKNVSVGASHWEFDWQTIVLHYSSKVTKWLLSSPWRRDDSTDSFDSLSLSLTLSLSPSVPIGQRSWQVLETSILCSHRADECTFLMIDHFWDKNY